MRCRRSRLVGRANGASSGAAIWLLGGGLFDPMLAVGAAELPSPPAIAPLRYTEQYDYLKTAGPEARKALWPWGRLKYIPLNETGDHYLSLGSEFRLRYERYEDNNWGEGPQDRDGYLWARALPLADLHLGESVRFFGQLISAFVYDLDVPESPVDEDRLDVLQGFAEVRLPLGGGEQSAVTLRPGRQLLTYGSGRLIDMRYGPNVLQAFDAGKASLMMERWQLDAFYARPVDHQLGVFDDGTDERQSLWSLYGTFKPGEGSGGLDAYYIGYQNKDATFGERMGRELRHTLATRFFGKASGWDWNFELFYQFGQFDTAPANGDISAWSAASDTGYTFESIPLRPRMALRANVISGDHDPNDVDVQTFNPLFPKGKYFGELSPIGPANLIHINPYASLELRKGMELRGNLAFYWRESTEDGIYALGGMNLVRADNGSEARYIGTQGEILLEYQANRHLSAAASYSVFTAGQFIKDSGAEETIHFFGLELLYRF